MQVGEGAGTVDRPLDQLRRQPGEALAEPLPGSALAHVAPHRRRDDAAERQNQGVYRAEDGGDDLAHHRDERNDEHDGGDDDVGDGLGHGGVRGGAGQLELAGNQRGDESRKGHAHADDEAHDGTDHRRLADRRQRFRRDLVNRLNRQDDLHGGRHRRNADGQHQLRFGKGEADDHRRHNRHGPGDGPDDRHPRLKFGIQLAGEGFQQIAHLLSGGGFETFPHQLQKGGIRAVA